MYSYTIVTDDSLHYRKNYGIFWMHNGNTRIWHFDLLQMAWRQQQASIVALMQLLHLATWAKKQFPEFKIHYWLYMNIQFFFYPALHCEPMQNLYAFNNSLRASHKICDRSVDNNLSAKIKW